MFLQENRKNGNLYKGLSFIFKMIIFLVYLSLTNDETFTSSEELYVK